MADDDFFKLGKSASDKVDMDLVESTNKSLSELNFDNASFMKGNSRRGGNLKNIGDVKGLTDNLTGFITTHDVANATLHSGSLDRSSPLAASSFNLSSHEINLNNFAEFLVKEEMDVPNLSAAQMGKFEGLNLSSGWFNKSTLEQVGHSTEISKRVRPLQTTLHEIGHTGSRISGADKSSDKLAAFNTSLNHPTRDRTVMASNYLEVVRERAFEEARAESFSYGALGKTSTGKEFLENLKSVDLTQDVTGKVARGNSFVGTHYYHYNEFSKRGFESYSELPGDVQDYLRGLGTNVEDLTLRANILGTGSILGATDFGDYSESFDPVRNKVIAKNREYILANHGQEYVDVFDDALKVGQENRFSLSGVVGLAEGTIDKPVGEGNLTEAGKARANVPKADKVLSAMDDDELTEYLKKSKDFVTEQEKIDPDGKAWRPQAENRLKNVENELRKRGIHPDDVGANQAANNANKSIPLADEYDTGTTSAKVASGDPISTPPPSAPPKTPPPKGPSGLGTPTNVKTQPGAHGGGGGGGRPPAPPRPPGPPPPPPGPPSPPPGPPTTSPTAPTAKIVTNTQGNNLTARDALRGIGEDIRAARKPGQRLLSADGSKAMAEAVTRGIKGSRNLKMLAVGSALGLAGYTANRVSDRDNPLDLEG